MASKAVWSIKGVDIETRAELKSIADNMGLSLSELLKDMLRRNKELSASTVDGNNLKYSYNRDTPSGKQYIPAHQMNTQFPSELHQNQSISLFDQIKNKHFVNPASMHHMPHENLHDIIVQSRDLRDALRLHTKDLTKAIKQQVEHSLKQETQSLKEMLYSINENIMGGITVSGAGNSDNANDLSNINTLIQESHSSLSQDMNEKINKLVHEISFALNNKEHIDNNGNYTDLSSKIEHIYDQIQILDNFCQSQLSNIVPEYKNIQHEINQYLKHIPLKIDEVLSSDKNNFELLTQRLNDIAHRLENIEALANSMDSEEEQEEELVLSNASQKTQTPYQDQHPTPSVAYHDILSNEQQDNELMTLEENSFDNINHEKTIDEVTSEKFFDTQPTENPSLEEETPLMSSYNQPENEAQDTLSQTTDFSDDEFETITDLPPEIHTEENKKFFNNFFAKKNQTD